MQGQRKIRRRIITASSFALPPLIMAGSARVTYATDGVWTKTTNTNTSWYVTGNWSGGIVADGIDSVADLTQTDILSHQISIAASAGATGTITTGTIKFADAGGASFNNVYTFQTAAGHTWNFQVSTGMALIERIGNGATNNTNFNANFTLKSPLQIKNNATGNPQLLLGSAISESGGSYGIEFSHTNGSGITQILSNASTYSGGTTITTGSIRVSLSSVLDINNNLQSGPLGTGVLTLKGGNIAGNGSATQSASRTIANAIAFDGNVILGGTSAGVNAAMIFTGDGTLLRDVQITPGGTSGGVSAGFVDYRGSIGGGYNLTIASGGIGTSGVGSSITLSGANTHTGNTIVNTNSRLVLNHSNALQDSTLVHSTNNSSPKFIGTDNEYMLGGLSGGTYSVTIDNSPFIEASALTVSSDTGGAISLKVGNNNGNATYGGVISGAGSLTKVGTGTQTLNASFATSIGTLLANSYSGGTTVTAGALVINSYNSGAGAVVVDAGATLGGGGTIASSTTVNGTLAPGASTGLLTLQSNVTMGSGSTTQIELGGTTRGASASGYDAANVGGTLVLDGTIVVSFVDGFDPVAGAVFDLFDWAAVDASNFVVATDLILPTLSSGLPWDISMFLSDGIVVAPEPGSMALLAGAGLVLLRRRRSRPCDA